LLYGQCCFNILSAAWKVLNDLENVGNSGIVCYVLGGGNIFVFGGGERCMQGFGGES
jgi:hypothetical protein